MLTKRSAITMGLAAMFAAGSAGVASASLDITEVAAGVAIPFETSRDGHRSDTKCVSKCDGGEVFTQAVITNAGANDITLHFDLINGDSGRRKKGGSDGFWESQSFTCDVTARETVLIEILEDGDGSKVLFECDDPEQNNDGDPNGNAGNGDAGNDGEVFSDASRGILWVTVQDSLGDTLAEDVLFADFTIVDTGRATAMSSFAAGFQGGSDPDGDNNYRFDGNDYVRFPTTQATNYLPPVEAPGELLVFTLDGYTGFAPDVRVNVLWYDDDERFEDDSFAFECMDWISYDEIADGLDELASAGHMELFPKATLVDPRGDGPVRVPFLCYNVQYPTAALHEDHGSHGWLGAATMRPCAKSAADFIRSSPPVELTTGF